MIQLPKKSEIASFFVDCQKTFTPLCPDELPVPEGDTIVPELLQLAAFARWHLASKEAHHPQAIWTATKEAPQFTPVSGDNVDIRWVSHATPGTRGFELLDGLPSVTSYDYFVWKGIELDMHPYGSCYHDFAEKISTGVIEFLRINAVTTVLVGGLATDHCVKNTVLQLARAGFQVILDLSATRGIAKDMTELAITEMQEVGVITIATSHQLRPYDN